jgi:hypothetical protein
VVTELVKTGADVNLQGGDGDTPLVAAYKGGHVSVVTELVKAGADVNLQDRRGYTLLIAACKGGDVSVVTELVKAGAYVNLHNNDRNTPLIAAVRGGSLSAVQCLVEHGVDFVTQVVDIKVSAVYTALILNKPDIVKYLIQEQNKISPGQYTGNVHLFNCLVDIRHAGVTTDSRDDVVVTDRSVWCMEWGGDVWRTISEGDCDVWRTIRRGDCDVLRRLLCVGLGVNQSIQLYDSDSDDSVRKSDVSPLLWTLIDEEWHVDDITEKVRMLLEVGVDVNVRVRDKEYDCLLDREGVSVLERTRRQVDKYSNSDSERDREYRAPKYKSVMSEMKKYVRRYSV